MFARIRDLREDHDLKQKELAAYLSVDQSTYSDYENGRINVPVDMLIKIADYYGVSLDYLVGRSDIKELTGNAIKILRFFAVGRAGCDHRY